MIYGIAENPRPTGKWDIYPRRLGVNSLREECLRSSSSSLGYSPRQDLLDFPDELLDIPPHTLAALQRVTLLFVHDDFRQIGEGSKTGFWNGPVPTLQLITH